MVQIDHFMYAVASMEDGIEWAREVFGVAPAYGGVHVGLGTQNALLSLGETYLEIIAPDFQQPLENNLGGQFAELSSGGLVTWAACGDLREIATCLQTMNIETAGPNPTRRETPEGKLLEWELLFPRQSGFGGRMPFFIDWLECTHPSQTNPSAGTLADLTITHPEATRLNEVFAAINLGITAMTGDAGIEVSIRTPADTVELVSTLQTQSLSFNT